MGNSANNVLARLIREDDSLQSDLLVPALRLAIGSDGLAPAVEDEGALRDILLLALDEVAASIDVFVATCEEIAARSREGHIVPAESVRLRESFVSRLEYASALYCALGPRLHAETRSASELASDLWTYDASPLSRRQRYLWRVQQWLHKIENAACRLEQELCESAHDAGTAYLTNLPMVGVDEISAGTDEVAEFLRGYDERGVPVFAMTSNDFTIFMEELFLDWAGGYDPSNRRHVMLANKLKAAAVEFDLVGRDDASECVILAPATAEQLYRTCSSIERRWLVDSPSLSSEIAEGVVAFADRAGWEEP